MKETKQKNDDKSMINFQFIHMMNMQHKIKRTTMKRGTDKDKMIKRFTKRIEHMLQTAGFNAESA